VSDDELKGPLDGLNPDGKKWDGVRLAFGAMSRTIIEGKNYVDPVTKKPRPLEVWYAIAQSPITGKFLHRSIRGRTDLAARLRTHLLDMGLAFLDVTTGELCSIPPDLGRCNLVDRKTGEPALLVSTVSIRKDRGRGSGEGTRYEYTVASAGILQRTAKAKVPELPLDGIPLLTIDAPEAQQDAEEATQEATPAKGTKKPKRTPRVVSVALTGASRPPKRSLAPARSPVATLAGVSDRSPPRRRASVTGRRALAAGSPARVSRPRSGRRTRSNAATQSRSTQGARGARPASGRRSFAGRPGSRVVSRRRTRSARASWRSSWA
jgi:hypothetical protein